MGEALLLVAKIMTGLFGGIMTYAGLTALTITEKDLAEPSKKPFNEFLTGSFFPWFFIPEDASRFRENWKTLPGPRAVFLIGLVLLLLCACLMIFK